MLGRDRKKSDRDRSDDTEEEISRRKEEERFSRYSFQNVCNVHERKANKHTGKTQMPAFSVIRRCCLYQRRLYRCQLLQYAWVSSLLLFLQDALPSHPILFLLASYSPLLFFASSLTLLLSNSFSRFLVDFECLVEALFVVYGILFCLIGFAFSFSFCLYLSVSLVDAVLFVLGFPPTINSK